MSGPAWNFCWHNVDGTWCFPGGSGEQRLKQQLVVLARTTNVLPLEEVARRLSTGEPLPPRTTTLTFDDGYADNLLLAVPLLEQLGLPATFFLVPGLLGRHVRPWWEVASRAVLTTRASFVQLEGRRLSLATSRDRLVAAGDIRGQLKRVDRRARDAAVSDLVRQLRPPTGAEPDALFLDWQGARELVRRGFTVASHSWHHDVLSRETAQAQRADLVTARAELQDRLQVPVDLLAYPNGGAADYDEATLRAASDADHTAAVTTLPGPSSSSTPPLELRRFVVSPRRGALELAKVVKHGFTRATVVRPRLAPRPAEEPLLG